MGGSHCGWTNKNEEKRGLSLTIDMEKGKESITIYRNDHDHDQLFSFLGITKADNWQYRCRFLFLLMS